MVLLPFGEANKQFLSNVKQDISNLFSGFGTPKSTAGLAGVAGTLFTPGLDFGISEGRAKASEPPLTLSDFEGVGRDNYALQDSLSQYTSGEQITGPRDGSGGTGGTGGQVLGDNSNNVPTPQGPSEEELNAIFAPSQSYLAEAESRLRQDYPSILEDIRSQYGVGEKQLETNKAQSERTIGEAETGARTRKQEAEAAGRRLFQELGMGGQQRFGRASSAGEAFSQINALEQQRRSRDISNNFNVAKREIDNQRIALQENFGNAIAQLQSQRDQAINQAQRDFQNKLLEIGRLRAENESAKANARLEALQALRNQVYQIQIQNQQFNQTLQQQAQQQAQQLQAAESALAERAQSALGAQSAFGQQTTVTPESTLGQGRLLAGNAQQLPIGRVNRDEDLVGRVGNRDLRDLFSGAFSMLA